MKSTLLAILAAGMALADVNQWTNVGPESVGVGFLTFDPQNAATVYGGTGVGLFKSQDGGASWTNAGLIGWTVTSMVIDPQTPTTLYAVTTVDYSTSQVFKSTDGGVNWNEADAGLPVQPCCLTLLAISPQNTATLYATQGPGLGIFRSADAGASWTATAGLPGRLNFFGAIVDPQNSNALLAAVQGQDAAGHPFVGIFKSSDGGRSWAESDAGLASPVNGPGGLIPGFVPWGPLTIDPRNPGTVYATRAGIGVYKSTDGGASWRAANSGLPNQVGEYGFLSCCVAGAVIDAQNTNTLYVPAMNGAVYKSTNGGANWKTVSTLGLGGVGPLTLDPHTGALYTRAGASGTLKSVDGGATWNVAVFRLRTAPVPSLVIDSGALYARGLKSTDGGMSWFAASSGIAPGYVITALAADPQTPGTVYAGTSEYKVVDGDTLPCAATSVSGIFKSSDGGMNWSETAGIGCVAAIAIDPLNPGTAYAGSLTSGVSKSIDGGSSWSPVNAGIPAGRQGVSVTALAVDPKNAGIVYAASGSGLFKSIDGGASWSDSGLTPVTYALAIDPEDTGTVFAATASGLFKSTDGGANWRNLSSTSIYAVAIHPQITSIVYAGTDDGVSQSTDGGESWTAISGGPGRVRLLMLDPQAPNTVYAGGPAGLFAISQQ